MKFNSHIKIFPKVLVVICVIVLCVLLAIVLFLPKSSENTTAPQEKQSEEESVPAEQEPGVEQQNNDTQPEEKAENPLLGLWVYDEFTRYEFNEDGSGCMYLEDTEFSFQYSSQDAVLYIDFDEESLHDATYQYSIDEDGLLLIGGEGTTGGEYRLTPQR